MTNVLFGNGLIIQYGGTAYTNAEIITRALANIRTGRFPEHLYPRECAAFLEALNGKFREILAGAYDGATVASFEKKALADLKRRYDVRRKYSIEDIGFEDYFLVFELLYNKMGIGNPDRFQARAVLRRMFVDAVYHEGRIQEVHKGFPAGLTEYLSTRHRIFTTNYDRNLEEVSQKEVYHLHGAFHTLDDAYDPESFRNQLSEDLLDGEVVDPAYSHLYSNILISYVSDMKSHAMSQAGRANEAMEKLATAYRDDEEMRERIDAWDDGQELVRRLKEAVRLKVERPELKHAEAYPMQELGSVSGRLEIVGLSPRNDGHVFEGIQSNDGISEVTYHSYGDEEAKLARESLAGKTVIIRDVRDLWVELGTPS